MTREHDKTQISTSEPEQSDQSPAVRNDGRVYTLDDLPPELVTAILNAEVPDDLPDDLDGIPPSQSEYTDVSGVSDTSGKDRR